MGLLSLPWNYWVWVTPNHLLKLDCLNMEVGKTKFRRGILRREKARLKTKDKDVLE